MKKIQILKPISKTQTKSRNRITKSKNQRDKMFINPKKKTEKQRYKIFNSKMQSGRMAARSYIKLGEKIYT